MNIFLVGATRGIGFQVLKQATEQGYNVTVLARNPKKLTGHPVGFKVFQGDILDLKSIKSVMAHQDAALCTIGIKPTFKSVTVFSIGTKNLIEAMKACGVRRLICVTGIGAGDSKGHGGFLYDWIVRPTILKTIYADKDRQEAIIKQSGLDWVIVRPAFLTNGPLTGKYKVFINLTGVKANRISRADVAHFMLKQLKSDRYLGQTPLVTY